MKISRCTIHRMTVPLIRPVTTALRTVEELEAVILILETDTGLRGYWEAAPSPYVTGDTISFIRYALTEESPHSCNNRPGPRIYRENHQVVCSVITGNTSAKAAADMVLWDLAARAYDVSVCRLLGGGSRNLVSDFTISAGSPEGMEADAREAVQKGYRALKVKVRKHPGQDIDCVLSVSEAAGRDVTLRLNVNQGWEAKETVSILRSLLKEEVNLELLEQPVPAWNRRGLAYVRNHLDIPVAALRC